MRKPSPNLPSRVVLAATTLVLLIGTAAVGGCGSSSEKLASAGGGATKPLDCSRELSAQAMLDYRVPRAAERYDVALMEVSLAGYYYQSLAYGAEQAAQEAGVELSISGGKGYTDPSQQLADAESVLNRGVDAIVLAPVDFQGSVPIVDRALAKGVPVVNISTAVDSDQVTKVLQDDYVQGQTSAKELVAAVPGGGSGIIMGGPANATWSRARVEGFKDELAKHPDFKIAAETNQDVDPAAGLADFENAVQAHPDPDWIYSVYVYTLTPDSIPAAYRDVPYVTAGYEPMVADALGSGRIDATVSNDPAAMGRIGVGTAIEAIEGKALAGTVICLPNVPLSKTEVGSPVADAELYPASFQVE